MLEKTLESLLDCKEIQPVSPDLRDFVEEDNQRFEKELEEWDAQLAQKALQEKLLASQKLRESESSVTTG